MGIMMDLDEVKAKKRMLEASILFGLQSFEQETGLSVSEVTLDRQYCIIGREKAEIFKVGLGVVL